MTSQLLSSYVECSCYAVFSDSIFLQKKNPFNLMSMFYVFVELKEAKRRKKRMAEQIKHEEALAAALKVWNTEILKDWETT